MTMQFQFQTGSIRRVDNVSLAFTYDRGFNSKLVRLEAQLTGKNKVRQAMFQFQTGSIRSSLPDLGTSLPVTFQFQTGSIRSSMSRCHLK